MSEPCISETPLLSSLAAPGDIARLSGEDQERLAAEIRRTIVATVARTGGHLSASLGVVELTMALLSAFDPRRDKIVWDVGHQTYAYKLLTGRLERFHTLRQLDGVCGFPSRAESPYDHFGVGHSSTSISAALGMAHARDLAAAAKGEKDGSHVIAVIGDGSMTAGLAYEGLNQAGAAGRRLIVILNDNELSISRNVGALSFFLSRSLSAPWIRRTKREVEEWLSSIPRIGSDITSWVKKGQHSLKGFFTPGMLFEAFRFNYMGPVDGHDMKALTKALDVAKQVDKPVLVHVMTVKGKGYAPAEQNPVRYHGVGRFAPETGLTEKATDAASVPTYTDVFGKTAVELAEKDPRVVAITAAMPEGTGLAAFAERFPERFVDVGICEQHAVTFAAGLAAQGFRPLVAVYSTFLQRSYDQIVHDVCLQNLPVVFCIDRAGLVGEDGATHQGVFDIAYLRHVPGMTILAPKDEAELRAALVTAVNHGGPVAIRYPRGAGVGADRTGEASPLPPGRMECLRESDSGVAVLAAGPVALAAKAAADSLAATDGKSAAVYNVRWIKPLPEDDILGMARSCSALLLAEEATLAGGFSSAVLELLSDHGLFPGLAVKRMGLPDKFVEHGSAAALRSRYGLDIEGIINGLRNCFPIPEKQGTGVKTTQKTPTGSRSRRK